MDLAIALDNLALLSRYRPRPPRVIGTAHTSTLAASIDHTGVPTAFTYDATALGALGESLLRRLGEDTSMPAAWKADLEREMRRPLYRHSGQVQGEAGLESEIIRALANPMVDDEYNNRVWRALQAPHDIGLGDPDNILARCEVKCGSNANNDDVDDEHQLDQAQPSRVVLGPRFFHTLVDYVRQAGRVTYSNESLDLINFAFVDDDGQGGRRPYVFEDPSDKENLRRVLCQIRSQICASQLRQANRGNRYTVLCTFTHAVLFTLHQDRISVSDPVEIDGACGIENPIGNVSALFYCISNLPRDEYDVQLAPAPPLLPRQARPAGPANRGKGNGHPRRGRGAPRPRVRRDDDGHRADRNDGQGPAERGGPGGGMADRLSSSSVKQDAPLRVDPSRIPSDSSAISTSMGSSADMGWSGHGTPDTSPVSSTFSKQGPPCSMFASRLVVHFDLPYNVAGTPLETDPTGLKIIDRGVYLSHHALGQIRDMISDGGENPTITNMAKPDDTTTLHVDAYLGIGATSTVFACYLPTAIDSNSVSVTVPPDCAEGDGDNVCGDRITIAQPCLEQLAIKYVAPALYGGGTAGGWNAASVAAAVQREIAVYRRLQACGLDGEISLRWFGAWRGNHHALGDVWCQVMAAGGDLGAGRLTPSDGQHLVQLYRRLHALGIVHGDVSRSNLCRRLMTPTPTPCSRSVASANSSPLAIIDFGMAYIASHIPRTGQESGLFETDDQQFALKAADEMRRVEDFVREQLPMSPIEGGLAIGRQEEVVSFRDGNHKAGAVGVGVAEDAG